MLIRDLLWRGVSTWPPEFAISSQSVGEAWILESVQLRDHSKLKLISVTAANHQAGEQKGIIILEDLIHLQILYDKLKENLGKSLREIGDMEIDFSLPLKKKA
jgi:hypothetical protein